MNQIDKPGIIDILMHFDKDCTEYYSRDTAKEIIEVLKNSLEHPISDEDEKKLLDTIPADKKLAMVELYKKLKDSPVSE